MKSSLIAAVLGLVAANGTTTLSSTPVTTTTTKYTTTSSTGGKVLGGTSYSSVGTIGGGESRTTTSGLISGLLSNNGISSGSASGSGVRYVSGGGYASGLGGAGAYGVGGGRLGGGYAVGSGTGVGTSSSEYGLSTGVGAVVTTVNGVVNPGPGGVSISAGEGAGNIVVVGGQRPPLDQYPKADLTNFYYSSANPIDVNSNVNSFRVINQANQNILTPNRSLDSIFIRFPSCSELDRLIISADTVALLKTIQVIATDTSVNCDQRITYLLELLGRLKTAI